MSRRIAREATAQNITGTAGVLGAIVSAAPTDWYAVNLAAGSRADAANLHVRRHLPGPAELRRFGATADSALQPIGHADRLGQRQPESIAGRRCEPLSGTYYIEVTGGSGSTGEYFLGTSIDPLAPAVSITPISPSPTNAAVSQMQIVFNGAGVGHVAGRFVAEPERRPQFAHRLADIDHAATTRRSRSAILRR